jgi:hypothetical protein
MPYEYNCQVLTNPTEKYACRRVPRSPVPR